MSVNDALFSDQEVVGLMAGLFWRRRESEKISPPIWDMTGSEMADTNSQVPLLPHRWGSSYTENHLTYEQSEMIHRLLQS